jgi:hypothetical protein
MDRKDEYNKPIPTAYPCPQVCNEQLVRLFSPSFMLYSVGGNIELCSSAMLSNQCIAMLLLPPRKDKPQLCSVTNPHLLRAMSVVPL